MKDLLCPRLVGSLDTFGVKGMCRSRTSLSIVSIELKISLYHRKQRQHLMGYIADLVVIHQYSSSLSHDIQWYCEFHFSAF